MYYLDAKTYNKISNSVEIRSISVFNNKQLNKLSFDCEIEEYNNFLFCDALDLDKKNISKTFLMMHKKSKEIQLSRVTGVCYSKIQKLKKGQEGKIVELTYYN